VWRLGAHDQLPLNADDVLQRRGRVALDMVARARVSLALGWAHVPASRSYKP